MEPNNHTRVTEFIMQGLFDNLHHQELFFGLFLCLYTAIPMGNSLIIVAIVFHPSLHTPMYFITNLDMVNVMCSSSVLPKMIKNLMQERKSISFDVCMVQLFAFTLSGGTELVLLTVMSYDRYIAICHPLCCVNLMTKRICISLIIGVWAFIAINSLVHTLLIVRLDFCGPNFIQHFFCEIPPMLALSCSSIYFNKIMISIANLFLAMGNFLLTTVSYGFIITTILKIQSSKRKQRAFSTCFSHLLLVILFYSSIIYTYIRPPSSYSLDKDKMVAIMYTLEIPTLNPLIYSLRNKEVKVAFRKILSFMIK
ncbi:olfactory receptor 13G1-like [Emydura macquarii macquarii]|uniref:olfactory receptor 13G1-like n=1 Tax=Emydura macquarii macquarii TaxID=1129001 RepID=UPI00352AF73F